MTFLPCSAVWANKKKKRRPVTDAKERDVKQNKKGGK